MTTIDAKAAELQLGADALQALSSFTPLPCAALRNSRQGVHAHALADPSAPEQSFVPIVATSASGMFLATSAIGLPPAIPLESDMHQRSKAMSEWETLQLGTSTSLPLHLSSFPSPLQMSLVDIIRYWNSKGALRSMQEMANKESWVLDNFGEASSALQNQFETGESSAAVQDLPSGLHEQLTEFAAVLAKAAAEDTSRLHSAVRQKVAELLYLMAAFSAPRGLAMFNWLCSTHASVVETLLYTCATVDQLPEDYPDEAVKSARVLIARIHELNRQSLLTRVFDPRRTIQVAAALEAL